MWREGLALYFVLAIGCSPAAADPVSFVYVVNAGNFTLSATGAEPFLFTKAFQYQPTGTVINFETNQPPVTVNGTGCRSTGQFAYRSIANGPGNQLLSVDISSSLSGQSDDPFACRPRGRLFVRGTYGFGVPAATAASVTLRRSGLFRSGEFSIRNVANGTTLKKMDLGPLDNVLPGNEQLTNFSLILPKSGLIEIDVQFNNDQDQLPSDGSGWTTSFSLEVLADVTAPPPGSAVFRYVGPTTSPGDFGVVENWQRASAQPPIPEPPRVPEKTEAHWDTIYFHQEGDYLVDVAGARYANRLIVENGNVGLLNGSIKVDELSVEEPSTIVGSGRMRLLTAMTLTNNSALIGKTGPAQVDVNNGGDWITLGRLSIGGATEGILQVGAAGTVSSVESLIGTGAGGGKATVEGQEAKWTNGNLAIGAGGKGELRISDLGFVESDEVVIGLGPGLGNKATVQGAADEETRSRWNALLLEIGAEGSGRLEVLDGGIVEAVVARIATDSEATGAVKVSGVSGDVRSTLLALHLTVGHGGVGSLDIEDGGTVRTLNDVVIGNGGAYGTMTVNGVHAASGLPSLLHSDGSIILGPGRARLDIQNGGEVEAKLFYFGAARLAGEKNEVVLSGPDAYLTVEQEILVGQTPGGELGQSVMTLLGGRVEANDLYVSPAGVIQGFGVLAVPTLLNEGLISPVLQAASAPSSAALARLNSPEPASPLLTLQGNYTQGAAGRLLIEIGGTNSADYDRLVVTGEAVLDGLVAFNFIKGFAPKAGDTIHFLSVGGPVNGGFARVDLQNLAPGFQFTVATNGSTMSMTALNDAVFDASLPALIDVAMTTVGGISYASYAITTSNSCHKIEFDGSLTRSGNTLRQGFQRTQVSVDEGNCFDAEAIKRGVLVLGALTPGDYVFQVTSDIQVLQSVPFTVPAGTGGTLPIPTRLADGRMRFRLNGPEDVPYRVEVSHDLKLWEFLKSGELPDSVTDDASKTNRMRFYRAIIGP